LSKRHSTLLDDINRHVKIILQVIIHTPTSPSASSLCKLKFELHHVLFHARESNQSSSRQMTVVVSLPATTLDNAAMRVKFRVESE
jgi:hypothetical protein